MEFLNYKNMVIRIEYEVGNTCKEVTEKMIDENEEYIILLNDRRIKKDKIVSLEKVINSIVIERDKSKEETIDKIEINRIQKMEYISSTWNNDLSKINMTPILSAKLKELDKNGNLEKEINIIIDKIKYCSKIKE